MTNYVLKTLNLLVVFNWCAINCLSQHDSIKTSSLSLLEETKQKNDAVKPQVAVIYLHHEVNINQLLIELVKLSKDPRIHGLLMVVDSYGGWGNNFCVIRDTIKKITLSKPVVGLILGAALSAGYGMVSSCNYLIAHSMAEVGSIGSYQTIKRLKDLVEKSDGIEASLEVEILAAGKFKALHNKFAPQLAPEQRAYLQECLEKDYLLFVHTIKNDRPLLDQDYTQWAEGKVFLSPEALKVGLIDEIGTVFEAERELLSRIKQQYPNSIFDDTLEYCFFYGTKQEQDLVG